MTNYAQQTNEPASPEQLDFLRSLATRRGVSFARPTSSAHASRQIDALLADELPPPDDVGREVQAVREDLAAGQGAVAAIHDDEIGGYGSTAHWR